MNQLLPTRVLVNDLCVVVRRVAVIERCAVKKRRNGWVLHYEQKTEPCAYRLGNGDLVMHSSLYEKMQYALKVNRYGQETESKAVS